MPVNSCSNPTLMHASSGHVWQGRYYSCPLDRAHFWAALRYTELNPVRARMVADPVDYPWSSADAIRRNTHTGRPLGAPDFVMQLEEVLHRRLAPQKGGHPPKQQPDQRQQALNFSARKSENVPSGTCEEIAKHFC